MKEQEMATVLDQEMAVLEQEIRHLQRRQDKIRKLRGLYTGMNILRDELGSAEVQLALSEEEMIAPGEGECGTGVNSGRDHPTCAPGFWH